MPEDTDLVAVIELLREPVSPHRWAAETVTLALRTNGDLVLRTHATGKAVELVMGEGLNDSISWWTVAAAQVPDVVAAALRDTGRAAAPSPTDGIAALEAVREVIGTEDPDEGARIATRFTGWLARHGIAYQFDESAREGY